MTSAAVFGVLFGIGLAALLSWGLREAGWPERLARLPAALVVGVHVVAAFLKPPLLWIYLVVVVGIYAGFYVWFVERARVSLARRRLGVDRLVGSRSVPAVPKPPAEVPEMSSERTASG
ncbi:hypothetical protein [Brockia lithotrophica]|uniref:Uncharacterized protein n=1 Tax=Brockia lithotrophica TaxID=933949 RepID=A0A660KXG3_9BACL|nr:hypothetical protein [Brockia lithotrophica]RKQ84716.1 hypothetical protein C7438_1210 [Brockia lithotrophica]